MEPPNKNSSERSHNCSLASRLVQYLIQNVIAHNNEGRVVAGQNLYLAVLTESRSGEGLGGGSPRKIRKHRGSAVSEVLMVSGFCPKVVVVAVVVVVVVAV